MKCIDCRGSRCAKCNQQGERYYYESPWSLAAPVRRIVDLIRFAEMGSFPVAGGTLDQTSSFLRLMLAWRDASALYESHE